MKQLLLLTLILSNFLTIEAKVLPEENKLKSSKENRIEPLLNRLCSSNDSYVMVVAHRGDWTNAPENSLLAIKNAIDVGVDIVEVDIRMTKDKIPVLMHDRTINRTTTGKGKLSNWTLDDLRDLYLKDSSGKPTRHKIPTLEEAMLLIKDKVLVQLDKCSQQLNQITVILHKTGTLNQVIIKRKKDFHKIRLHNKCSKHKLIYIPQVKKKTKRINRQADKFIKKHRPAAFDIRLTPKDTSLLPLIKTIKKSSCSIWINTISSEKNPENKPNFSTPDKTWGWVIDRGANIIISDKPASLINYLRQKGLHN